MMCAYLIWIASSEWAKNQQSEFIKRIDLRGNYFNYSGNQFFLTKVVKINIVEFFKSHFLIMTKIYFRNKITIENQNLFRFFKFSLKKNLPSIT